MPKSSKEIVEQIYSLRENFLVIGLTGRTGSGCTTVADILSSIATDKYNSEYKIFNDGAIDNNVRKNRIVAKFIEQNCKTNFFNIKASDIIFYFVLLSGRDVFEKTLQNEEKGGNQNVGDVRILSDNLVKQFNAWHQTVVEVDKYIMGGKYDDVAMNNEIVSFIHEELPQIRKTVNDALIEKKKRPLYVEYQNWGNLIRQFGSIDDTVISQDAPVSLASKINRIIKLVKATKQQGEPTLVVIDALRNPLEVLFFRERYASFYLMSVNTTENVRKDNLLKKAGFRQIEIDELDREESEKKDFADAYQKIDIDKCIEMSDVYVTHDGTPVAVNRNLVNQIHTYVALMMHPGLVTPSPEERVMQVALTAKYNSGCLSRQVGAAVTDEHYSIKSIGWNTVAEGQTPCNLRNLQDLLNKEDEVAYSRFEKENAPFHSYMARLFEKYQDKDTAGLPCSYCFKDVHTTVEIKQRNNQVHTRSLHAEENAFLQLAKYGSEGIKGGKLFTTASPCELCAKKAYQLGIKEVYYIDAYPGISKQHIFECGNNAPSMKLFSGAIGRAYISLYAPFIAAKDELECRTSVKVKNIDNPGDDQKKSEKIKE